MTPKEKMTKAVSEGFDWLFARIAMVLGETDRPSYETRQAATEARRAAWMAQDAFRRFEAVARGDAADEDQRQPSLPGTGPTQAELDAEAGRAKLEAWVGTDLPDAPPGEPPLDQELSDAQRAIDEQLAELGCLEDAVDATVERDLEDPTKLYAEVGHADEDEARRWAICREYVRVMAALRGLAPGAGPEAVRACLCGLAEQMDAELGADGPVDGEVGVGSCTCGAVEDDLGVVVHADDCGLCGVSDDQVEAEGVDDAAHAALRELNPPAAELEGGFSHDEALRLLRGQMVSIRWPGSADGTDTKLAMVERVNPTGATVAVYVARTTPKGEYTGELGKELRWVGCRDVLRVEEAVGREFVVPDLPGRPAGEPAKRRSKKAKPPESSPAAYYDDPSRRYTGD